MAQVVVFKYHLRKYNTSTSLWEYFYVDNTGVVLTTTTKTPLPQAPKGWDGQTLMWERGFQWYGVFTNYSNPLQFVNDGAKILKDRYYKDGIEAECQLYIEKHTLEVATWGYVEYYKGDIDFSRFKDMKDYVDVSIMDSGFLAKLKANESKMTEIPVEAHPDVVWVRMDGLDLVAQGQMTGSDQPRYLDGNIDSVAMHLGSLSIQRKCFPTLSFYGDVKGYSNGDIYIRGNETIISGLTYSTPAVSNNAGTFGTGSTDYWFIRNEDETLSYDIRLKGYMNLAVVNSSTGGDICTPYIGLWISSGGVISGGTTIATGTAVNPSVGVYQNQTIEIDYTFTLPPQERVYFFTDFTHTDFASSVSNQHFYKTELEAIWFNKVDETYIPALPAVEVAQGVCEVIDSGVSTFDQPIADYPAYLLTSGDALRNLSGSVLKTSFANYFAAHNCMFNSAFMFDKVNNEAQFVYKWFVFDTAQAPLDIGEVNNIEVSPLTQEMFAKLKVGYKPFTYDDFNGKDEFNTELQFQSPINRVSTEKNLVSPYRADMYGIELTRANLTNKTQADNDSDNDIFWLHIDDSAPAGTIPAGLPGAGQDYYNLYRDNTLTITGVVSPSMAFNIDLSPKRRIFAWGYWIRSMMYPNTSPDLVYQTSFKSQAGNAGLETDDGVTIITEKLNEAINGLPGTDYTNESPNRNEIFYPLIFTVEAKIPTNIMDLMTNPHGEIQFSYKGNTYYGWLLQVSDEPSFTPKQTYKLIASTSNTLTDLINGI